jgi:thymidylate synthase
MRGDTDSNKLQNIGINIWKNNTSRSFLDGLNMHDRKEGVMGPMYGYQWRHFNASYDENKACNVESGVDQLQNVIDMLKNDPFSRRIMMTTFNPAQLHLGVLPPCHSIVSQFYVSIVNCVTYLDMFCYNRSQDVFLGTPFNIASSALLLTIISKIANMIPRYLYMSLGDIHIYDNHFDAVNVQLKNIPYQMPNVSISDKIKSLQDVESLSFNDFSLVDYKSHDVIKAHMIA